jgi:hypothetical protein
MMSAIQFTCPGCGATLRTQNPALAGKQSKCPKCGATCAIPAAPAAEEAPPAPAPAPATPGLAVGQRVFARWHDGFWYPATLRYADAREVMVKYDDGEAGSLTPGQVRPLQVAEGDRVQARWQGGPAYYPGTVAQCGDGEVLIDYDDGEQETVSLKLLRVIRAEDIAWKVSDRVLANWVPEPFFYPAVVTGIRDDGIISVAYEDGECADVLPGQVLPLELKVGAPVFARWQLGPAYYPAVIAEIRGDDLRVRYDDGSEEQTKVRYLRVLPPPPGEGADPG